MILISNKWLADQLYRERG